MTCKHCGAALVARYTREYPINERGEYNDQEPTTPDVAIVCVRCGARHAADWLRDEPGQNIIALEYASSPDPVASVCLVYKNDQLQAFGADVLVGLAVIDETRKEVGRFLSSPRDTEWWEAWKLIEETIPKGEYRASYADKEE